MSSCSKIRQDNTLMKIQMRPQLKFPSRGKPQGNRIFPSCGKRAGLFSSGRECLLRRRGEIFTRRAVRAPCGRHRAGNRFFRAFAGHWGRRVRARRKIFASDAAGRGGIFEPFFVYCACCGFLLAKFRRKLKRLSIAGRYSAF